MVCCLTSFKSNIASVTIFEIFAAKILDLNLGRFKVIQGQRSCYIIIIIRKFISAHSQALSMNRRRGMLPIDSALVVSYLTTVDHNIVSVLSPFLKYLRCDFNFLEPAQFKVIQGQRSLCQSKAHWWFPIGPPLCPTLYLSRPSRYFMWRFPWPRSRTIQGHPKSRVIVSIDSPREISCSTSVDPIIVSVTIFEIFDV